MVERIVQNRFLTPEEAAKYREELKAIEQEIPDIRRRYREGATGPSNWEDFRELIGTVRALRNERERQGLTLDEIANRSRLSIEQLRELEAEKNLAPPLPLLSRYADALGHRLAMTLAVRVARKEEQPQEMELAK